MNTPLDDHQRDVLITLVEASRRGSHQRPGFSYTRRPPDEQPHLTHPGLRDELVVGLGDIEVLQAAGLIRHQAHIPEVGSVELTQAAYDEYSRITAEVRPSRQASVPRQDAAYVDQARLAELQALSSAKYDLTRLVRLCEEVNIAWAASAYHATAMIVRAIMDHVPPIFGVAAFTQIGSNYAGARSFKEAMTNLEAAARKIGDSHLHTNVRAREVLPTATQVNFSNLLDLLLGEIARILK
jgi:hypothetical protein